VRYETKQIRTDEFTLSSYIHMCEESIICKTTTMSNFFVVACEGSYLQFNVVYVNLHLITPFEYVEIYNL